MPRAMELVTPLGEDVLLFHRMRTRAELGRLGQFDLDMLSKRGDINPDDILAKNVTVKLELPADRTRYFNGYVTRFTQIGMHGRYYLYHATVRPWLWFLTRRADCRIFQEMKVPDILKQVFDTHPKVADVASELSAEYVVRNYCVQYRETDFNFVSRLMEEEGIYYYFKHIDGRHTLVLADSYNAHSAFDGYAQLPFIPLDRAARPEKEYIKEWNFSREVQPGTYALGDFDFEKPSVDLKVKSKIKRSHELADYEIFDYPGEYLKIHDGEQYARTRIEELHAQFERAHATTNARGVSVGYLLKMTGNPRSDQNREYLVVAADYELEYTEYEAMDNPGTKYECSFTALNSGQPFRPLRATPRPTVQGPQTAIVVGPTGDEIYTDKYGRVKVQFHWDRYGKEDENSSCWIRVAHPWAGKTWGMVAIPRIGHEVIVDFLEGDPDRPIITGRVYNAEQMPPYELPANMTQTGAKTRSSKGGAGANFNEIRFEDKKGSEQVFIHAEKNQDIGVENDETHTVGHDRTKTIDHDETTQVKHNRMETVGEDDSLKVGKNIVIDAGDSVTITTGSASISMKSDGTIAIKGMDITIDGSGKISVTASSVVAIKGSMVGIN